MGDLKMRRVRTSWESGIVRSALFVPADQERKVRKALSSGADAVILDLEDSVLPEAKTEARKAARPMLEWPRTCRCYVRINGLETPWWREDLQSIVAQGLDGVVMSKVDSVDQIRQADEEISLLERSAGIEAGALELMAIIETARGVVKVDDIAAASRRLKRLALGAADYAFDLNLEWTAEETELEYARMRLVHASRAADIDAPLDSVVIQFNDPDQFRASARRGRRLGFQGKLCIHPNQVDICNEMFTPSEHEASRARMIVARFEQAEADGSGATKLDGILIDAPILKRARRVIEMFEAAPGRQADRSTE